MKVHHETGRFQRSFGSQNKPNFFWQQRHYVDPPERPSYQPHTTEGVISGMKSEQTSRFSVIVRIPIGTPKLLDLIEAVP